MRKRGCLVISSFPGGVSRHDIPRPRPGQASAPVAGRETPNCVGYVGPQTSLRVPPNETAVMKGTAHAMIPFTYREPVLLRRACIINSISPLINRPLLAFTAGLPMEVYQDAGGSVVNVGLPCCVMPRLRSPSFRVWSSRSHRIGVGTCCILERIRRECVLAMNPTAKLWGTRRNEKPDIYGAKPPETHGHVVCLQRPAGNNDNFQDLRD